MMSDLAKRLTKLVFWMTLLLGGIAFFIGLVYGWKSPQFQGYLVIAAFTEVWVIAECVGTWKSNARYRWFWWKR
ncbi:MAG: hypothetical protein ABIQ18_32000 [Umezawaea sp.]